jgi:uncharacterized metal-binding protein YceD (DUF177 family)
MSDDPRPFTFPVEAAAIPPAGRDYQLTADAATRAAVARYLAIEAIDRLMTTVTLIPEPGGLAAHGRLDADVTQACVVSLAPVRATLEAAIARHFIAGGPSTAKAGPGDEEGGWVDPEDEVPDLIVDGLIDLGQVVVEELALALDPYPRAPGATFAGASEDTGPARASPFAVLGQLRTGKPVPRRDKPAKHGKR